MDLVNALSRRLKKVKTTTSVQVVDPNYGAAQVDVGVLIVTFDKNKHLVAFNAEGLIGVFGYDGDLVGDTLFPLLIDAVRQAYAQTVNQRTTGRDGLGHM